MPKMKTKSGAKKRFKCTGSGKYVHKSAGHRHILTNKSTKRKRNLRGNSTVFKGDEYSVSRMILA